MRGERDSTQDWALPPAARPPTVRELELRIEEALAVARASEAAACEIGDAALEAARQARRAAELAERASAAALAARREAPVGEGAAERVGGGPPATVAVGAGAGNGNGRGNGVAPGEDGLARFSARADRLAARFRALQTA